MSKIKFFEPKNTDENTASAPVNISSLSLLLDKCLALQKQVEQLPDACDAMQFEQLRLLDEKIETLQSLIENEKSRLAPVTPSRSGTR